MVHETYVDRVNRKRLFFSDICTTTSGHMAELMEVSSFWKEKLKCVGGKWSMSDRNAARGLEFAGFWKETEMCVLFGLL